MSFQTLPGGKPRRRPSGHFTRQRAKRIAARDTGPDGIVRCHLCKEAINLALPASHPESYEVDHIRPIAQGGADTDGNCASSHKVCNRKKGAGTTTTPTSNEPPSTCVPGPNHVQTTHTGDHDLGPHWGECRTHGPGLFVRRTPDPDDPARPLKCTAFP